MNSNTVLKQSTFMLAVILSLSLASSCSKKKPKFENDSSSGAGSATSSGTSEGYNSTSGSNSSEHGSSATGTTSGTAAVATQTGTTQNAKEASPHSSGNTAGNSAGTTTGSTTQSGQSVAMITPSGTGASGTQTSAEKQVAQAPAAPPPPNCYQISYKHKGLPSHNSDEACSQHKNIIQLKHKEYNKASLCVRVNNTPVKFQIHKKNANEVIVGSVAGPNSVITATYCIKKNTCKADCKVPKDEFLDAIGGTDDKVALWDATDTGAAELDAKVKKELAEFNETQGGGKGKAFKDWISDEGSAACENPKQAQKISGAKQPG